MAEPEAPLCQPASRTDVDVDSRGRGATGGMEAPGSASESESALDRRRRPTTRREQSSRALYC